MRQTPGTVDAPVVHLSGIGPVDENAGGMADVELQFEHDSDWSELGDGDAGEDPDSNSEGFYGNDYPEVGTRAAAGHLFVCILELGCGNVRSSRHPLVYDMFQFEAHSTRKRQCFGSCWINGQPRQPRSPRHSNAALSLKGMAIYLLLWDVPPTFHTPGRGWRR